MQNGARWAPFVFHVMRGILVVTRTGRTWPDLPHRQIKVFRRQSPGVPTIPRKFNGHGNLLSCRLCSHSPLRESVENTTLFSFYCQALARDRACHE